jgi:hypothetical protein
LARVSVDMARAIVVLATAESPERSDARVLRVVLSLMGVHDRLKKAGRGGLQARTPRHSIAACSLTVVSVLISYHMFNKFVASALLRRHIHSKPCVFWLAMYCAMSQDS